MKFGDDSQPPSPPPASFPPYFDPLMIELIRVTYVSYKMIIFFRKGLKVMLMRTRIKTNLLPPELLPPEPLSASII